MKALEVKEILKEKGIKSITSIGNLTTSRNPLPKSDFSSFSFQYRGIDFSYIVDLKGKEGYISVNKLPEEVARKIVSDYPDMLEFIQFRYFPREVEKDFKPSQILPIDYEDDKKNTHETSSAVDFKEFLDDPDAVFSKIDTTPKVKGPGYIRFTDVTSVEGFRILMDEISNLIKEEKREDTEFDIIDPSYPQFSRRH